MKWLLLLFFQFCKTSVKKYNMTEADEDDWMFFCITSCCYTFSNADGIKKPHNCWQKFLTWFNLTTRSAVAI